MIVKFGTLVLRISDDILKQFGSVGDRDSQNLKARLTQHHLRKNVPTYLHSKKNITKLEHSTIFYTEESVCKVGSKTNYQTKVSDPTNSDPPSAPANSCSP